MKCPHCGHWNQPSFPRCFKCGAPLDTAEKNTPDWQEQFAKPHRDKIRVLYDDATPQPTVEEFIAPADEKPAEKETLSEEMVRLRSRRARGEKYLEEFRQEREKQESSDNAGGVRVIRMRTKQQHAPRVPIEENPEDEYIILDENGEPIEDADPELFRQPYDDYYDDSLPPTGPAIGMAHRRKKKKKRRMRKSFAAALWLVRILVALCVLFAVWEGWSIVSRYVETKATSSESVHALIETCEVDGLPGHRITIAAAEGTQCYISELTKSYVAVGGVITINVADHTFYNHIENLEADSMTVELTPTMIYAGKEERMAPITYDIDIPQSTLVLISPETNWLEVTASVYNIRFQVTPGSEVIVNNTNISDTVSEDGVVDYNPVVQAIGDNIVSITVRAPYCRENSQVVTLYREPMSIPIELAADTLARTDEDIIRLTATTKAGATITMGTPYVSIDDTNLSTTGKFTVDAKLTRVGDNEIVIYADYPGLERSMLTHSVYYLPPASKYTTKAWALGSSDYAELMNNIQMRVENAQIYLCRGTITQIISEKPQLAIMDTGSDGKEQLVMLQNETSTTWKLGESYRVYADVSGVYGSMPKFMARYTYGL